MRNSAGWNWNPAIMIQLRFPFASTPSPGTKTSSWKTTAPISAGHAARFQNPMGRRLAMNISGMPSTANTPCLMTAS